MTIKKCLMFLICVLTINYSMAYGDNYYYNNNILYNHIPVVEVPITPYVTYSTHNIPTIRYEWVPVYTYQIVKPIRFVGLPYLRYSVYEPITIWELRPVIRY
jgi:hypothetical protein